MKNRFFFIYLSSALVFCLAVMVFWHLKAKKDQALQINKE